MEMPAIRGVFFKPISEHGYQSESRVALPPLPIPRQSRGGGIIKIIKKRDYIKFFRLG